MASFHLVLLEGRVCMCVWLCTFWPYTPGPGHERATQSERKTTDDRALLHPHPNMIAVKAVAGLKVVVGTTVGEKKLCKPSSRASARARFCVYGGTKMCVCVCTIVHTNCTGRSEGKVCVCGWPGGCCASSNNNALGSGVRNRHTLFQFRRKVRWPPSAEL